MCTASQAWAASRRGICSSGRARWPRLFWISSASDGELLVVGGGGDGGASDDCCGVGDGVVVALAVADVGGGGGCLLYTSPSPRDKRQSRMPSSA